MTDAVTAETAPAATAPRPWGFWSTSLWALLSAVVWMAAQLAVLVGIVSLRIMHNPDYRPDMADVAALSLDGWAFAITTFISTPIGAAVFWLAARVRGWRFADYVGLKWPGRQHLVVGIFFFVLVTIACDSITYMSGRPLAQDFATELYQTSRANGSVLWLALAVIVVAPIGEELFFRGFVFRGWSQSRLGAVLTIVLTSLLWTSMHVQYDWFFQSQVFTLGILFGWLRWTSGSVALTILLHMAANLEAALVTAWFVAWTG